MQETSTVQQLKAFIQLMKISERFLKDHQQDVQPKHHHRRHQHQVLPNPLHSLHLNLHHNPLHNLLLAELPHQQVLQKSLKQMLQLVLNNSK